MYFKIDSKFKNYFKNLKQVFLYITDECNLQCKHCLYKPNLTFHLKNKEINYKTAIELISDFREMGASKLTIMGGEPTIYGEKQEWRPLILLIRKAKNLGYKYVRLDTNGQFNGKLLLKAGFRLLDEITFSLDGFNSSINDPIRGRGSFKKCLNNIKKAIKLGYKVDITCCLHKKLAKIDSKGNLLLDKMILFAESLGVNRINFHDLLKSGIPRDCWTGNYNISIKQWLFIWKKIQKNINKGKYKISVRIPQCFVTKEEFNKNSKYYGYCPVKMGERVLVHPDGIIRICSLMIGTPYGVARFYDRVIAWDNSLTNEILDHKIKKNTPCTNQSKGGYFGKFCPLCVSFKPKQKEFIWENELKWERKKITQK